MLKEIVAVVWVTGAAALAQAGPLAPTKASQLVTLQASGTDPICGASGKRFGTRVTSDGQFELDFVIPQKQVLVVTGVEWAVFGEDPGDTNLIALGTNGGATYFVGTAQAGADGTAGGAASFSHTIRPGTTLCISTLGVSDFSATLHGFLAKDR